MRLRYACPLLLLLLAAALPAQQTVVTCPPGQRTVGVPGSAAITVTCEPVPAPPPPPPVTTAPQITAFAATASVSQPITLGQAVTFTWTVTGTPAPTVTLAQQGGPSVVVTASPFVWTPTTTGDKLVTITAVNSAGAATPRSWTVRVNAAPPPPPPPPPADLPIFPAPVTDPEVLGTCTEAEHNSYLVNGGDGFRYWRWHPQQLPSGCRSGHEHGSNPAPIQQRLINRVAELRQQGRITQAFADAATARLNAPILFGQVARQMPMPGEPDGHKRITL